MMKTFALLREWLQAASCKLQAPFASRVTSNTEHVLPVDKLRAMSREPRANSQPVTETYHPLPLYENNDAILTAASFLFSKRNKTVLMKVHPLDTATNRIQQRTNNLPTGQAGSGLITLNSEPAYRTG